MALAIFPFCGKMREVMLASLHGIGAIRAIFFVALLCAAVLSVLLGGCVHRVEIRQGDLRVAQNAESVSNGMSESEVEDLLGKPQTQSPFRRGQWIYFYKKRAPGFFGKTGQFVLKINFENKRVRDFQILEEGDLSDVEAAKLAAVEREREAAERAEKKKAEEEAEAKEAEENLEDADAEEEEEEAEESEESEESEGAEAENEEAI